MINEETLPKVFIDQVKRKGNETFLIHKYEGRWRDVSWNKAEEKVKLISFGLIALGVKKGDRISALSRTRPELAFCCLATANVGAIFTPLYPESSLKECEYFINDSGAKIVFAEDQEELDKLEEAWNNLQPLEKIVVFDKVKFKTDPRIMSLDQLCDLGRQELIKSGHEFYFQRIFSVKPDDRTAIVYTPGTTGPPKGVLYTNKAIIRGFQEFNKLHPVSEKDRGISSLPMAQALELLYGHWYHVYHGFPQVYAESMETLFHNIYESEPTFIFSTPLFFEKHYNKIWGIIEDSARWKKRIINWCVKRGERFHKIREKTNRRILLNIPHLFSYLIAYLVFFRRVRKIVGRKIRFVMITGAPVASRIVNFFWVTGIPIYQGYSLTECQGMVSVNHPGANRIGTVGRYLDGLEVGFTQDNEILVKGWPICHGYWNNSQASEVLSLYGWLNTGDIGFLDEERFLHIVDRKNDILITSSGQKIAPLHVENLLRTSRYISQAVIIGKGKKYLTALIILNKEEIIKYARDNKVIYSNFADLTTKKEIIDLVEKEIETKNRELAPKEQVKKFMILEEELRHENGEMTPTLKVKREVVKERHKDKIEAMYKGELSDLVE